MQEWLKKNPQMMLAILNCSRGAFIVRCYGRCTKSASSDHVVSRIKSAFR